MRILVIDDDVTVAKSIGRVLRAMHHVEIETDPAAALGRVLDGERFDLILCDKCMSPIDGEQFLACIRDLAERPVFVLMSGSEAIRDAGADGFLIKPFRKPSLVELVERLAEQRARAVTLPLPTRSYSE